MKSYKIAIILVVIICLFIIAKIILDNSGREVDNIMDDNWNKINDSLIYDYENDDMSSAKKIAALCYWYDAEVQNGGHIQYFTNDAGKHYKDALVALDIIGARKQKKILKKVVNLYKTLKLTDIKSEKEYIDNVLVGYDYEFENEEKEELFDELIEKYDDRYYDCTPEILDLINLYAHQHKDEFGLE